jgi:hypothetical protein
MIGNMRMSEKQRRHWRKSAKSSLKLAEKLESTHPEISASTKSVAAIYARLGLPNRSKKRKIVLSTQV